MKFIKTISLAGITAAAIGLGWLLFSQPLANKIGNDIMPPMPESYVGEFSPIVIHNFGAQPKSPSGHFLAGYFAQSRGDWQNASKHFVSLSDIETQNIDVLKRAMILSVGIGDLETASRIAKKTLDIEAADSMALLVIAVRAIETNNLEQALSYINQMPEGDITEFVEPLLKGWIEASLGQELTVTLDQSTIHLYHKALIALLQDKPDVARQSAATILEQPSLSLFEIERVADLHVMLGEKDKALGWYQELLQRGDNVIIQSKVDALEQGDEELLGSLTGLAAVDSVAKGVALSLYDMALILSQDHSYSITRLFASMALAINPDVTEARLLMANALVQAERYDEAITYLKDFDPAHPTYIPTMRHVADLLAEDERYDEAKELLNSLFIDHNDVKALIQIGDMYRRQEEYQSALNIYNQAVSHLGEAVPDEYWFVLYGRGMAYEREGQWEQAEADLKAALVYRPNHPYLLNYLGYGWAEQGMQLDKALELIEKAVRLKPRDGYIQDSMGWVLYRMGEFEEAVPYLETAVELLPYDPTINDHLGDAYWMVDRTVEARYQWERAKNHEEDELLLDVIGAKIKYGLDDAIERDLAEDHSLVDSAE